MLGGRDKSAADVSALLWDIVVVNVLSYSEAGEGAEESDVLEEHFARKVCCWKRWKSVADGYV